MIKKLACLRFPLTSWQVLVSAMLLKQCRSTGQNNASTAAQPEDTYKWVWPSKEVLSRVLLAAA